MKIEEIIAPLPKQETVFIVGSGFSKHVGLPLQADFTEQLLQGREAGTPLQKEVVGCLADFVELAFDHGGKAAAKFWPELEDIFTIIDLAANSGHHLGKDLSPAELRSIRRMLLSRIIYMLDDCYSLHQGENAADEQAKINKFFTMLPDSGYAFISMNWDTVIERKLFEHKRSTSFDYMCEAVPSEFSEEGDQIATRRFADNSCSVPIVKMHGSTNWLYCDNCRKLFYFTPSQDREVAMQILTEKEVSKLQNERGIKLDKNNFEKWKTGRLDLC